MNELRPRILPSQPRTKRTSEQHWPSPLPSSSSIQHREGLPASEPRVVESLPPLDARLTLGPASGRFACSPCPTICSPFGSLGWFPSATVITTRGAPARVLGCFCADGHLSGGLLGTALEIPRVLDRRFHCLIRTCAFSSKTCVTYAIKCDNLQDNNIVIKLF